MEGTHKTRRLSSVLPASQWFRSSLPLLAYVRSPSGSTSHWTPSGSYGRKSSFTMRPTGSASIESRVPHSRHCPTAWATTVEPSTSTSTNASSRTYAGVQSQNVPVVRVQTSLTLTWRLSLTLIHAPSSSVRRAIDIRGVGSLSPFVYRPVQTLPTWRRRSRGKRHDGIGFGQLRPN